MSLPDAAWDGDLEALRDRIAQGDDVDGRDDFGSRPLINACFWGHHECAQALIDAGAAVDVVANNRWTALMFACVRGHHECARALIEAGVAVDWVDTEGFTALMIACSWGRHECARALLDAGAAVDQANNFGETALMKAVASPSLDRIREECDEEGDVDNDGDEDSDMEDEVFEQQYAERLQRRSERRLEERRQGRAWCVQALLEAMAPIRAADFLDRAASFMVACMRLRVLGEVLAARHVIEHASVLTVKARVVTLTADAQGVITDFARAVLAP